MDAIPKIALFGLEKLVLLQGYVNLLGLFCYSLAAEAEIWIVHVISRRARACVAEHCMVGCNSRQSIGVYTRGTPVDLG